MNDNLSGKYFAQRKRIGIWLSNNCGKPANTLNGVSFAELMRMLGGGV